MYSKLVFVSCLSLLSFISSTLSWSWTPAVQVSGLGTNFNLDGAINSSGDAELVWTSGSYPSFTIQSSTCTGAVWSPPVTLDSGLVDSSSVGIDATGNAVAIWVESVLDTTIVKTANKPFGGSWSAPTVLSTSLQNGSPKLAMNAVGNVIAVWIDYSAGVVQTAYLTFGGAWSAVTPISSSPETLLDLQVDIDSAGNGYAVWRIFEGNDIYVATSLGSTWGDQVLLSLNGDNKIPQVGSGGILQALSVWVNSTISEIRASQFSAGTWNKVPSVVSSDSADFPVVVGIGTNGIAAWLNVNSAAIETSNFNSGVWSYPPAVVSVSSGNDPPTMSVLSSGTAVIAWSDYFDQFVRVVFYPDGGVPGVATAISPLGNNVDVQSASSGLRTIVAWRVIDTNDSSIFATIN